jgi:hypothetical protein
MPYPNPLQYVGGYTLDLYCDHQHTETSSFASFYGQKFSDCAKEARKRGWRIDKKTRTATCPEHRR